MVEALGSRTTPLNIIFAIQILFCAKLYAFVFSQVSGPQTVSPGQFLVKITANLGTEIANNRSHLLVVLHCPSIIINLKDNSKGCYEIFTLIVEEN